MKIAIYGCGGMGREAELMARDLGAETVMVSDDPLDGVLDLASLPDDYEVVVAIASASARRAVVARCEAAGRRFACLTSATANVRGDSGLVGTGALWCDFSLFTGQSKIGRHFQCNAYSAVGHDCVIGDFVTLGPRVTICGNTVIEDDVYIGNGAILRNGFAGDPLVIGKGAFVGMGAVVNKDVPPGARVFGNPARALRPTAEARPGPVADGAMIVNGREREVEAGAPCH